jgi:hypothetical protein
MSNETSFKIEIYFHKGFSKEFLLNLAKMDIDKANKYDLSGETRDDFIEKELTPELVQELSSILYWNNDGGIESDTIYEDEYCINDAWYEVVEMYQKVYDEYKPK